ncbi:hypothetical protein J437_LFUL008821 [Ladona fulva]|uniref:DNA repair endonuclease XPF n=1 Tax=Ladona fulva TaxID=123851 RepID=A0A8K0P4U8_LADFU|nr:hypothetical protein J437_LFUL008821 [Ladona fulva]
MLPCIPVLETSPKWTALSEALKEIQSTFVDKEVTEHSPIKVLVRVTDARTSRLLLQYLSIGSEALLTKLYERALKDNKLGGNKSYGGAVVEEKTTDRLKIMKEQVEEMDIKPETEDAGVSESGAEGGEAEDQDGSFTLTLTQQSGSNDLKPKKDVSESKDPEYVMGRDIDIVILPTKGKDPNLFGRTLSKIHPQYIIVYDADISSIRQIEVYQAYNPACPPRIYFLMYRGSVEEQAYLTSLRQEKEAFEHLIQQKSTMVVPEEREGRSVDVGNPELDRDLGKEASVTGESSVDGRKGGGRLLTETKGRSKVIVDMREFNSELPSIIHRRGIDIEPVTLNIGDYILTKDICVERKSISDLIGSLHSGRLYNQATAMTRHYTQPILLIEFDKDKPFVLQGKFYVSTDGRNTDVASRLQLLTLHFPRLRLVWSPSPYATAELFEELKQGRPEPNAEEAAAIGVDEASKLTSSSAPVKFNSGIEVSFS